MSTSVEDGVGTGLYRMGAVASLTGLPAGTIRAWERRYGMLNPERTDGGFRLYTEDDIKRLSLIQRLRAFGEPISAIANLEIDDLNERLRRHSGAVGERAHQTNVKKRFCQVFMPFSPRFCMKPA